MVDLDNIFKYASPKYVYIRDAKLGILKYTFMLLIFIYVVLYQICYGCTHLKPEPAAGAGAIGILQPQYKCNEFDNKCSTKFDKINTLEYCLQYKGTSKRMADDAEDGKANSTGDQVGDFLTKRKACRFFDSMRLRWDPVITSEFFIPTRLNRINQIVNANCYDPTSQSSPNAQMQVQMKCKQPWTTESSTDIFVADVGKFTVDLTHSFNSAALQLSGTSLDYQGFFAACAVNTPMTTKEIQAECKRFKIPSGDNPVAPEDLAGLSNPEEAGIDFTGLAGSMPRSDRIRLEDLLKLTPAAQKYGLKDLILDRKLPDSFGHGNESLREKGGMLILDVNYDNTGMMRPGFPFAPMGSIKPITYTYRPHFVPVPENVKYQLIQNGDNPQKRTVDVWYGITIKMSFNGRLVKFTYSGLLTALTAGLLLVTTATTIVTGLASYVLPLKEKYSLLMYQFSEDFGNYSELHKATGGNAASMYWVGAKLLEKVQDNTPLTNQELLGILCTTEKRLNRLDGMDPKVVFEDGQELDKRNYEIGNHAREFYKKHITDDKTFNAKMSYACQGDRRQTIKNGQSTSDRLGKLD